MRLSLDPLFDTQEVFLKMTSILTRGSSEPKPPALSGDRVQTQFILHKRQQLQRPGVIILTHTLQPDHFGTASSLLDGD
jgi:hypothetical protein